MSDLTEAARRLAWRQPAALHEYIAAVARLSGSRWLAVKRTPGEMWFMAAVRSPVRPDSGSVAGSGAAPSPSQTSRDGEGKPRVYDSRRNGGSS